MTIEQQAAESSPYWADSKNDKAYIEGFSDAGTRMATNLELCELKLLAANKRIKELEADNKFQEEVIISCGGNEIEKIELEKKLATAIEALEKIDNSNDCMKYFNIDVHNIVKEALAKLKENAN